MLICVAILYMLYMDISCFSFLLKSYKYKYVYVIHLYAARVRSSKLYNMLPETILKTALQMLLQTLQVQ
jgi:hypothetical protein